MVRSRISWGAFAVYILLFLLLFLPKFPAHIRVSAPYSVDALEGFLRGFFVFPLWFCELIHVHGVRLNQVPNDGYWYDMGYFVGLVVLVAVVGGVVVLPGHRRRF